MDLRWAGWVVAGSLASILVGVVIAEVRQAAVVIADLQARILALETTAAGLDRRIDRFAYRAGVSSDWRPGPEY